jgi:hypothetical protein
MMLCEGLLVGCEIICFQKSLMRLGERVLVVEIFQEGVQVGIHETIKTGRVGAWVKKV